MTNKNFFARITPLQLVIAICVIAVTVAVIVRISSGNAAMVSGMDTPAAVAAGDEITVRISAPEVSDLYGYQFQLAYDDTLFSAGAPESLLADMPTIFKKDFEGYTLVGATMTGDTPGYSAANTDLCEVKLTALTANATPEIKLTDVSVVSSTLEYKEDIEGWTYAVVSE